MCGYVPLREKLTKKRGHLHTANVYETKNGVESPTKHMSIVMFLGRNVKEYSESSKGIIQRFISGSSILCEKCLEPMARHSSYERGIKETGQKITITMVWCSKCKISHAVLPDFLLPNKHYSGNEIENVIIESATVPANQIETEASVTTVRRWIVQISEGIVRAVGILKYLFKRAGQAVSEAAIEAGPSYSELEQILDMAPSPIRCSGNKLGLANLWVGTYNRRVYI